jgi:GDP-mannose pyrophosphatase NudK
MEKQQMILIAGPYRSGTNDDHVLIEKNVHFMNEMALEVYKKGHLPVLGEWFALPLIATAGSKQMGDEIFNQMFHPVAVDLITFCTAVLRVGGASKGADEMIKTGQEKGKIIYNDMSEVPVIKN